MGITNNKLLAFFFFYLFYFAFFMFFSFFVVFEWKHLGSVRGIHLDTSHLGEGKTSWPPLAFRNLVTIQDSSHAVDIVRQFVASSQSNHYVASLLCHTSSFFWHRLGWWSDYQEVHYKLMYISRRHTMYFFLALKWSITLCPWRSRKSFTSSVSLPISTYTLSPHSSLLW